MPQRFQRDGVGGLSRHVLWLVVTLLVVVTAAGIVAVAGIDRMRADLREQATRDIPALSLLLNIDRDAYQAQLGLERFVRDAAVSERAANDAIAMWSENSQQVIARWEQFSALASGQRAERREAAAFERDRAHWLASAEDLLHAPAAERSKHLTDAAARFDTMRDHLDVLEEQFYEPAIQRRAADADHNAAQRQRALLALLVLLLLLGVTQSVRISRRAKGLVSSFLTRQAEVLEASEQQKFETSLQRGLEVATDEEGVQGVLLRALTSVDPGRHASLLLADASDAHLHDDTSTGDPALQCQVATPSGCPAVARSLVQRFPSSDDLDACPHLVARAAQPLGAVCIPLSIGGRAKGVLHSVWPAEESPDARALARMEILANQVGTRLGVLRAFAATSLQAARDPLTGLLNRRTMQERVRHLSAYETPGLRAGVIMADLDRFKNLNDTHGHTVGDRVLQQFCRTLVSAARQDDLVCRWGGEEFLMVLPDTSLDDCVGFAERIREELRAVAQSAHLPSFTVSFGVVEAPLSEGLEHLVELADRALYRAKQGGRDLIVVNGAGEQAAAASLPAARTQAPDEHETAGLPAIAP